MNKKPISQARDPLLRGVMKALKRAAKRARREAEMTGTCLIIDDGQGIVRIDPKTMKRSKKS
jgi:hypothetical protein